MMRDLQILLVVFLATLAGSCGRDQEPAQPDETHRLDATDTTTWSMFRGNPAATGVAESVLTGKLELVWTRQLASSVQSTAAIVGGTVFVGTDEAGLLALDLATGKPRWSYATEAPVVAAPCVADGRVFFGDLDGTFHAVDAQTGESAWKVKTDGKIIASANVSGEDVLVGSYDNTLYCYRRRDGSLRWKHETENFVNGSVCVVADSLALAGCDGVLRIIETETGNETAADDLKTNIGSTPARRDGRVFVTTYDGRVVCVDVAERRILWDWHAEDNGHFTASAAVTRERVIVGDDNGKVWCLEASTGLKLWGFETRQEVESSPVVSGDRVYVGSTDGKLYELDLNSGRKVWEFDAGSDISASAAIARRRLVISSGDGAVYCFRAKSK